ncbi:hypothetical protein [Myxococcus sp. AB025B]|uniref:hypothetical protein n=1 Tax=Myxococcus sp. AB025B TaxID=2562794 RepID=UPI0011420B96|nr:hypothetical protein [Myxococcus sp. AB025B]
MVSVGHVPARASLEQGAQALSAHPSANEVEDGTTVAVRNPDAALDAPPASSECTEDSEARIGTFTWSASP